MQLQTGRRRLEVAAKTVLINFDHCTARVCVQRKRNAPKQTVFCIRDNGCVIRESHQQFSFMQYDLIVIREKAQTIKLCSLVLCTKAPSIETENKDRILRFPLKNLVKFLLHVSNIKHKPMFRFVSPFLRSEASQCSWIEQNAAQQSFAG